MSESATLSPSMTNAGGTPALLEASFQDATRHFVPGCYESSRWDDMNPPVSIFRDFHFWFMHDMVEAAGRMPAPHC